ncbi:hypothetical protein LUZ60_011982 [Juncus effusus]|nr:hypothetical protein LUZ60_011982 [Juncus effusus]
MGDVLTPDALDILSTLKTIGLCTNLDAPKQRSELTFDKVLSAFLKETSQKGKSEIETLPFPPIVGEGCQVDLLRLFCVVRARGGYLSVTTSWSWPDVAESVGLRSHLGPSVKLVYVKYLRTLERLVQQISDKKADPTLDKGLCSLLKRKRDSTVGMLNWVKDLAKRPFDPSNNISVLNEAHIGNKQNMAVDYFKLAVLIRSEIFLKNIRKDLCLMSTSTQKVLYGSSPNSKNKETSPVTPIKNPNKQNPKKNTPISPPFTWLSIEEQSEIPVGPNNQAIIPDCIKNQSYQDLDPSLNYLGTHICPLDNSSQFSNISSQKDKIGRNNCQCLVSGSIDCMRFHITENKLVLKRELGPAFYKMGFHKMGDEISLSWKEEEEVKFKFVIRENSPNDGFNYWDPLRKNFKCKGWRGLVNYYFNVFLVRRRAYQNRMIPDKIDSDDDEVEAGFLDDTHFCVQSRQCMDFDP